MSKSPYRRPSRRIGTDKVRKTDSMSLLPVLESLEERRLLTTITVPAGDDPLSGPNLDLDNVPEAVFFTYYTQPFVNDLTNPTDLPDVASRALAIKVTISGTPGAEVDIKDLFGRDVYFRPFPDALAPPRVTFEGILENSDTSFDENGDFVLDPNGSAAYDTGPDSVESAVVDINGDQLADILTVNYTGPNAVTIQYGQGQPFVPGENGQDDQPAEPDGTFGPNTYTDPESGEEVEVQSAIPYPSGTAGAYAIEVVDLDGDDFPEVIVAMRNTDNVVIFQNLGSTPVDPENPEEMKFEGFDDGTIIGVGDQPIDLAVDDSSNIWVLNYGDETIQQVVSQGNQRVFTLFGESGDRNLVDADNNNIGDALGAVDDARITIGRQAGDTLRGYISFQLTSQLIDAITLVGQHVVKSNLLVSGIAPPADIEYDVNLYMAATNQPDSDAAISDFEDTNYSIRIDSDGNPFLSGANQELPDQGRVYRISLGAINDARIQEAADTGNNFFDFRMQGNHPLFGIDESQLTQDELDQLDALAPYRLNSADADSTQFTVPTLNITLSDTFVAGTTYPVGEQPTSLNLADVDGDGFADFIVSNAGTDDIWYFRGNGTPTGFGLPDSDGDGFRDPTKIFSTQRPDQFNPSSADIDGDGIYDPIPDDSNPNDVAVADIDGDGFMDLAVALKGNSYPGITMTTSTGQNLANTIIPGGLAVFWGNGQLSLFQDFDSSRDGVQPDFLEDSFLENQPDPIITDGVPDLAFTLDPFFRGPAKIEVANINPVADFFEGDGVELNDLIVATVDPFAGSGNDTLAAVATRGGVYTLTGKYDAAHEWETITIGTYNPATGIYRNSPVLLPGEKIHGRVFSLPLETDTTLGFTTVPPDLPSIPYVDVVVLDVDSETLSAPIVGDVAAPDLIFTRSDNATPYEIDGDGLIRNVRVLLQGEGEPDPVPYYNDGIGSLVLSSADEDTRLTATAGIINAVPFQGSFVMDTSVGPIIAAFQPDQPLTTTDLPLDIPGSGLTYPDGSGRLMIGTPNDRRFTRNEAIYNAPSTIFMRNPSYGIRVEDGQSVDRIVIDGRLLGRTVIDGSIDVLTVGWLGGDVIINGDAGLVNVATDAGYIDVALQITPSVGDATESDLTEAYNFGRTGNIIQVGRTLRDLMVGGTLSTQVKVLGEVSDPSARNPLDNYRIVEYEAYQTDPANPSSTLIPVGPGMVAAYDNNAHGYFRTPGVAFQGGVYGDPLRGNVTRRGSTIYSENQAPLSNSTQRQAQFLGGPTTAVELVGWLDVGLGDGADFYTFAAAGGSEVQIKLINDFLAGDRQLGAHHAAVSVTDSEGHLLAEMMDAVNTFTFTAPYSGAFFISITDQASGTMPYVLQMQGLAPVTLGQTRSGAATVLLGNTAIQTTGGSIGRVATGQRFAEPDSAIDGFDGGEIENFASLIGFSDQPGGNEVDGILSAGNIFGIHSGSDIAGVTVTASGYIGDVIAGYNSYTDDEEDAGDIYLSFFYADSLSYMKVRESFGGQSAGLAAGDLHNFNAAGIKTTGSIGTVSIHEQLLGTRAFFITGPNSMIDKIEVEALERDLTVPDSEEPDFTAAPLIGVVGDNPLITTGTGSDVRFLDIPNSNINGQPNFADILAPGSPISFTDDSGAEFTLRISGGDDTSTANVYFYAIDGSEGLAVSRIDANLAGGATLLIRSDRKNATTSIGRIRILSDSNAKVRIDGPGEVDIYRIEAWASDGGGNNTGEAIIDKIENRTPGGDIVAIDVHSLNNLEIRNGNLGETETSGVGPTLLGPALGFNVLPDDAGQDTLIGTAMIVPIGSMGSGSGVPLDTWLNGVSVRTGDVNRVRVGGRVGDVYVGDGLINRVIANADHKVVPDGFDGIVGSVYADNINRVDVGSGLAGPGESSQARAGIFADNGINRVTATRSGNDIRGVIAAAGTGIARIDLKGGASMIGADILASTLSNWAVNPGAGSGFSLNYRGIINRVNVAGGGDIYGTRFRAGNINRINISSGAWDTNVASVSTDINQIRAAEFRNSVVRGRTAETPHNPNFTGTSFDPDNVDFNGTQPRAGIGFDANIVNHSNWIQATRDINDLQALKKGNITNLVVEAGGDLVSLRAQDIVRTTLQVATTINRVEARGRILASDVIAGDIDNFRAGTALRTTRIESAGPIDRVEVRKGEIFNTFIRSDGTDGRIGRITAKTRIENGQIESAGPVQLVQAKKGDVNVTLTTFRDGEADLGAVVAGRDIRGSYNVDGDINLLRAKENIGTDPALLPTGADPEFIIAAHNLREIDARKGQIYTEIRVLGAQTGTIRIGDVVTRDGSAMSPSTASYIFAGTVNNIQSQGAFDATIESQSGGIGKLSFKGDVGSSAVIRALDGGISNISITGTFAGNVYSDEDIVSFGINGTTTGGSLISDQNIRSADFSSSVSGFYIQAGDTLQSLNMKSSLSGSVVAAAELINKMSVGGLTIDSSIVAGLESTGADGLLGGGDDVIGSGDINNLSLLGGSTRVNVLAGWDVGPDGTVDPLDAITDDTEQDGISRIFNVTTGGTITDSFIRADTFAPVVPGFDGTDVFHAPEPAPTANAIFSGASRTYIFGVTDPTSGAAAELWLNISYVGPGYVEPVINDVDGSGNFSGADRLTAINIYGSDNDSAIAVNGILKVPGQEDRAGFAHLAADASGLTITGADDRSIGAISFDGNIGAADSMFYDGNVGNLDVAGIETVSTLTFNAAISSLHADSFTSGTLVAHTLGNVEITSGFGGDIFAAHVGKFTAGGVWSGLLSSENNIDAVTASSFQGTARAAGDISDFQSISANNGVVSAGDNLSKIRVAGIANATSILAGLDVGTDGTLGTTDDVVSNGNIASVNIGDDFSRGNVIAGLSRGTDGFFGTSDDIYAPGISNIGPVVINGDSVGSNLSTEEYGVFASGVVASVTVNGRQTESIGNFNVSQLETDVLPVKVTAIDTILDGDTYKTSITFNQQINTDTLDTAISISSANAVPNDLVNGTDYTISYDETTMTANIRFASNVGKSVRPPDQGTVDERPPGIYEITIEADPAAGGLLSRTSGNTFDGDGDGFSNGDATEPDYVRGVLVGDAGDRLTTTTVTLFDNNTPIDPNDDIFATLYGAVDLTGTNTVPLNEVTTIHGILGNHPDQDTLYFPDRLDVDVYSITVEAGDTVRIRTKSTDGKFYITLRDASDYNVDVVRDSSEAGGRTLAVGDMESGLLFQRSGTYYLTVVAETVGLPGLSPFPNWPPSLISHGILPYNGILSDPGTADLGGYDLEILHYRDGDSGFGNSSDGFEGTLIDTSAGPVTIDSAIGFEGFVGKPKDILNDADVYLLNNGNPLPAGSVVDLSLLVSDLGSAIESVSAGQNSSPSRDTPGAELAVFDVTDASNFSDAILVAAPTIGNNGSRLTGFDDFSYSITLPGAPGLTPGSPSSDRIYAVMVQGNQQSDYQLNVNVTTGNGLTPQRTGQNVVIETAGGFVDWLEAFGRTELDAFDLTVLGMEGSEQTVLNSMITRLNADFASVNVTFATSSAAFEGQDFTTVFLTSSLTPSAFGDDLEYGFNSGIDVLNTNKNQEAVVFLPKFSNTGVTIGNEDALANALSNVVAKELAKTFGLRELDGVAADLINTADGQPDGLFNDVIMTENNPIAWTQGLPFVLNPLDPFGEILQLDPGEFLLGSGSSMRQLDAALAD